MKWLTAAIFAHQEPNIWPQAENRIISFLNTRPMRTRATATKQNKKCVREWVSEWVSECVWLCGLFWGILYTKLVFVAITLNITLNVIFLAPVQRTNNASATSSSSLGFLAKYCRCHQSPGQGQHWKRCAYMEIWNCFSRDFSTWGHHGIETLSASLGLNEGNPPETVDSPPQKAVMQTFLICSISRLLCGSVPIEITLPIQGYVTDTGAMLLSFCEWANPNKYGQMCSINPQDYVITRKNVALI